MTESAPWRVRRRDRIEERGTVMKGSDRVMILVASARALFRALYFRANDLLNSQTLLALVCLALVAVLIVVRTRR